MKYAGLTEDKAIQTLKSAVKIANDAVEEFWTDYQSQDEDKKCEFYIFMYLK